MSNNFIITFQDGTPILRVEGSPYSLKKRVLDASGRHLFDIAKSRMHAHTDMFVKDPNGKQIMELKNKFSCGMTQTIHGKCMCHNKKV